MYVSFEFEFENEDGQVTPPVDVFPDKAIKFVYNDGSVNTEWVTKPINWNDWKRIEQVIWNYSKGIDLTHPDVTKAGFHITFSLAKFRDKQFKKNYFRVIDAVFSNYPSLIWLSTWRNRSRETYYRQLHTDYKEYFTKSNYPAVLIPSYKINSSVVKKTLPEHHKIEFRISDTNYRCPAFQLFIIDLYKQMVIKPTWFINKKGASTKYYRYFNTIAEDNRKKLAGDIIWLLERLLKRRIQDNTRYIATQLIEHLQTYPYEAINTEKTEMFNVKNRADKDTVIAIKNIIYDYAEEEGHIGYCTYCDRSVSEYDNDYVSIDGHLYCSSDCAENDGWIYSDEYGEWMREDEIRYCENCDRIVHENDIVERDGYIFCSDDCADEFFKTTDEVNENE